MRAQLVADLGLSECTSASPMSVLVLTYEDAVAGEVVMWDLMKGSNAVKLRGHKGVVSSLAVAVKDDVTRLLTGGADGTIKLWEL